MKKSMYHSTKFISITLFVLCAQLGCATGAIDRSLVNDSAMQIGAGSANAVSPLSGLKNRSQNAGGGSCGVCAH